MKIRPHKVTHYTVYIYMYCMLRATCSLLVHTPIPQSSPRIRSPMPQSPALSSTGVSVASGGATPDETTLESLGVKIGDKVIVDAGTTKAKVREGSVLG